MASSNRAGTYTRRLSRRRIMETQLDCCCLRGTASDRTLVEGLWRGRVCLEIVDAAYSERADVITPGIPRAHQDINRGSNREMAECKNVDAASYDKRWISEGNRHSRSVRRAATIEVRNCTP